MSSDVKLGVDSGSASASAHGLESVPDLARLHPYTMVPDDSLLELARHVNFVLTEGLPGDFVECGVWRGGAAFLMADLLRQAGVPDRKVWLFDSFAGLPPPRDIDGRAAQAWAAATTSPHYYDNCTASFEEVRGYAATLGLSSYVELVQGWFEETLPSTRERIGPIAILRIDADWYASVRVCLDNLYDQVVEGGLVVFDDYYAYDGCAVAVHEFLGERRLPHRLEPVTGTMGDQAYTAALFRKADGSWRDAWTWSQRLALARRDLAAVIPPGATLILVDDDHCRNSLAPGGRCLPFLEREGRYWGPPGDDTTAIRELERLRVLGARFMVVAWPAFWWLEHYAGFHHHLRATARCVLHNERLVIFDLMSGPGNSGDGGDEKSAA